MAKEALPSRLGPGEFQLLTDDAPGGQARPLALLLQPFGEFGCKTNANSAIHLAEK
jgi:hypothetical protein